MKRILVVDDGVELGTMLERHLKRDGYESVFSPHRFQSF